jgi:diguanylate cyclase (GGDEF)-like protein
MDNTVPAPERAARKALSADLPSGWVEVQEGLAAASGLSLLTVEGRQPPSLAVSNNNSICQAFQSSTTHAHLCEPDCGEAFFRANEAGAAVHYRCHAGLQCFAAPVQIGGKKTRAVIGGRCFLRVADYRALAERIRAGDLSDLLSAELFANVIFASRQDLEDLAARVEESAHAFAGSHSKAKETEGETPASKAQAVYVNGLHKVEAQETADAMGETTVEISETAPQGGAKAAAKGKASKHDASPAEAKAAEAVTDEAVTDEVGTDEAVTGEAVETVEASAEVSTRADAKMGEALKTGAPARAHAQTRAGGAQGGSLEETCRRAVGVLARDYGVESLALLLRADDSFYATCVTGQFERQPPRVTLKPKEIKLLLAATGDESIAVPAGGRTSSKHEDAVELFPLTVGEDIKGALLVGDSGLADEQRRAIAEFCRDLSMPLELLRLREELERRARAASQLRAFTEVVNSAQPDDAYTTILRHSAELLHAERGSLLLFDERAGELSVKAAVGPRADVARDARVALGEGVAGTVMREGRPAVVRDVSKVAGLRPAPDERRYKTRSFISYPIVIAGRKVGVLNMTDKAGGGDYDESDLGLLDLIAPQMALALDRVEWHSKATQFQLLSITDPLTGLVNRRYLEERLQEELERSKRHRFAMSFLMVDIDDFKNYNDQHGHQAGDLALEMTAQCLKTALRSADVAARYGGEEFSILLPQTSLSEGRVIAERIRRRIERTQFPHGKAQPLGAVTISIGISSFGPETDTPSSVIYAADRAMYAAKSRGKNCCEAFEPKKPASEGGDEKGEGKG